MNTSITQSAEIGTLRQKLSEQMRDTIDEIRSINPDLHEMGYRKLVAMENQKWAMDDEIARLKIENGKLTRKIYGLLPS